MSWHPSFQVEGLFGGSPIDLVKENTTVPQLICAAGPDDKTTKPKEIIHQCLEQQNVPCEVVEYADMVHGWMSRGDRTNADVQRDVKDAFRRTIRFLDLHMPIRS